MHLLTEYLIIHTVHPSNQAPIAAGSLEDHPSQGRQSGASRWLFQVIVTRDNGIHQLRVGLVQNQTLIPSSSSGSSLLLGDSIDLDFQY